MKKKSKKKLQKSWGLETGELVYKSTERFEPDYLIGMIVSIWDACSAISCDVYWFGAEPKLERGLTMSQIRAIAHFPR